MDVIVVGGGQAGLAVSYLLTQSGIHHLVLERGEVGESWRSQRWDSFCLNTPNWFNALPGCEFHPEAPDAFSARDQVVSFLEQYARSFDLPVREHTAVTRLERLASGRYALQTEPETLHARAVVLASGAMTRPRVPDMAERVPREVVNLSAGTYKNAEGLPEGAVVVVGSGQSGCQIAEDLLAAGRPVYLCASRVGRLPRAYRGRDTMAWGRDMGFFDVELADLEDPSVQFAAQPQVSGTHGGHTVSLQSLARDGATLLGRVEDVEGYTLKLAGDLRKSIAFADEQSQTFKTAIDTYIDRAGVEAEDAAPDPGEPPLPDLKDSDKLDTLDLRKAGVRTIVWCTGFDADWSWVKVDVFDERGLPRHRAGVTESQGLYFMGLPWLSKRKSGILYGVPEDAARIVQHIEENVLTADADSTT